MKSLALMLLTILTLSGQSFAQGSGRAASSSDIEKACLKLEAELTAKDKEIESLKADNADLKVINEVRKEKEAILREIISLQNEQISDLRKAGSIDKEAIGKLIAQRDGNREELNRVRSERDKANSRLRTIGAAALTVGIIIGAGLAAIFK